MANAIIGALRVNLGLDSANFQNGLKRSQSSLDKFASAVKIGFAAAAAAATGAFMAISNASQRADDLKRASVVAGADFQEFQRLAQGAKAIGIQTDKLSDIYKDVNDKVGDFLQTGAGPMADFFENIAPKIGLTADEFARLSGPQALQAYYNALEQAGLSQAELTFYMEAIASDATMLIPLLRNNGAEFARLGDQAERLGLILSDRTAEASRRFNENLRQLYDSMTALWNRVLAGVIPAFENLSARLVSASQNSQALDGIVIAISASMNILARGITFVFDNLQHLYDLLKVFVAAKAVTYIVALGGAFISLARTVRVAGLAMALVTSITRAKITTIALLAAVIAKLTGQYDNLAGFLSSVGQSIMNALPESVKTGVDGLAQSLKDLAFGIEEADGAAAASFGSYLGAANDAAASFGNVGSKARSAANGAKDAWDGLRNVTADTTRQMNQAEMAGESFGQTLASSLQGLFDGSKKFSDVLKDIASQLANMALSNALKGIFGGLFGGTSGGGFLSSIFSGFRADGGPVAAGRAYVVGERGPELMVPGRSGTVIPNDALRSSSGRGGASEVMVRGVFVDDGGVIKARIEETVTAGISEYDQTMPERIGGQMNQARRMGTI